MGNDMEKVLSGKPIAALVKATIKDLVAEYSIKPRMCLIQLGEDPASAFYVQNIVSNASRLGCEIEYAKLPGSTAQEILLDAIQAANADPSIHGIMLQKPLPSHIDDALAGAAIDPGKDIDCLNPLNLGKLVREEDCFLPCTPLAVICTLRHYRIPTQGRHAVIIGRSPVVGKSLANLLLWKKPWANASVTVCHSRSQDLSSFTSQADILVAAMGKAEFVTADMVGQNSVLIDVGINEVPGLEGETRYVGDIDYNGCFEKASALTPVPGGIGSVTTSLLFLNLVKACLAQQGTNKSIDDFLDIIFKD
jgi:methylenetetrahydrofolate dehydrogenase (NADP+)/methenyltetrahydrofolate cyclohydrolase